MTTNKKESLLVASGVFVLTTGCIEMLRWFGYLAGVSPLSKTSLAAALGFAAFLLFYLLKNKASGEKSDK